MHRFIRRLRYLLNKRRLEADLADELAFHRDQTGNSRLFGSAALAHNQARDVWIPPWLQDAAQDIRFAARLLGRDRGFTLVVAGVLGLGIGVDNTLLLAVNAACLRGLPIERADRVLFVGGRDGRGNDTPIAYREFEMIRDSAPMFSGIVAHTSSMASVGDDTAAADRALMTWMSSGAFAVLGQRPVLGRDFSNADHRAGAASVTILGGGLWARRYGSDPSIVGRTIRVNGRPSLVIGVIKTGFRFPRFSELWQPLEQMPQLADRRSARNLELFGRLRDGAAPADGRAAIDRAAAQLARDFPETNQKAAFRVVPINERYNQKISDPSWIGFMITGAIVLLVACANAANLLLMRSAERAQEIAIRASLGASRLRIVRQLLIECTALALVGGAAGGGLAVAGGQLLTSLVPESAMPFWVRFTMDGRMLIILSAVTLATVFIFGLAPAMHVANTDVNDTLKDAARTTVGGRRTGRWTNALLIGEFALSVVLVTMLVKGERVARLAERTATAYDPTNVATGSLVVPADRYGGPGERLALYSQIEERLAGMPAIGAFAFAAALPGTGAADQTLEIEGHSENSDHAPHVWSLAIGPRYFEVLRVPLLRGRPFDQRDGSTGAGAAIVNQQFVDQFFQGIDPIGRRIRLLESGRPSAMPPPWLAIAGVAPTLRQRPTPDPDPIVYVPLRGSPPASVIALARGSGHGGAAAAAAALRDVVRAINPDLPVARLMPMEQAVGEAQWAARGSTRISQTVVIIAFLLAAAGLYAVTAHAVVIRRAEISVRRALGATASHIVWMVWRRALIPIAIGSALGVVGALVWERLTDFTASSVTGRMVSIPDIAVVVAVVAAVGTAACVIPVWRAVQLDPLRALRRQ